MSPQLKQAKREAQEVYEALETLEDMGACPSKLESIYEFFGDMMAELEAHILESEE